MWAPPVSGNADGDRRAAAAGIAPAPDDTPPLVPGVIVVWRVALDVDDATTDALAGRLVAAERVRAGRLIVPAARRRFVVARAVLRRLLGHYTGVEPGALRLVTGPRGKPAIAGATGLRFNVAHSGDYALIGVCGDRELGVDIEAIPRDLDPTGVAAQVFSDAERSALQKVPEGQRHDAFARIWTRKEAYIKALGEGFSYPTRSFTVSPGAGDDDALLADIADEGAVLRWRVRDLAAPTGYRAAVAGSGRDWTVRQAGAEVPANPGG